MTDFDKAAEVAGNVRAISPPVDPRVEAVAHTLMGASTEGFVECIVIGIHPRNAGVKVIGSGTLEAMRGIAALEIAKGDLIAMMKRQVAKQPEGDGR